MPLSKQNKVTEKGSIETVTTFLALLCAFICRLHGMFPLTKLLKNPIGYLICWLRPGKRKNHTKVTEKWRTIVFFCVLFRLSPLAHELLKESTTLKKNFLFVGLWMSANKKVQMSLEKAMLFSCEFKLSSTIVYLIYCMCVYIHCSVLLPEPMVHSEVENELFFSVLSKGY